MKKFTITNTKTGEKQDIYTEGTSMQAKRDVCRAMQWETADCSVRFVG